MSPFVLPSSGAPTFIAASASQSLSGLDLFSPVTAMDPNLLDGPDWYASPEDAHHAQLSPQQEHFSMDFGQGFASHGVPVSHQVLHRRFSSSFALSAPFLRTFLFFSCQFPSYDA